MRKSPRLGLPYHAKPLTPFDMNIILESILVATGLFASSVMVILYGILFYELFLSN